MLDMVCVHLRIVLEHKGNCSTTWVDVPQGLGIKMAPKIWAPHLILFTSHLSMVPKQRISKQLPLLRTEDVKFEHCPRRPQNVRAPNWSWLRVVLDGSFNC